MSTSYNDNFAKAIYKIIICVQGSKGSFCKKKLYLINRQTLTDPNE